MQQTGGQTIGRDTSDIALSLKSSAKAVFLTFCLRYSMPAHVARVLPSHTSITESRIISILAHFPIWRELSRSIHLKGTTARHPF